MRWTGLLLEDQQCVEVGWGNSELPRPLLATFLLHIEKLGYTLAAPVQERLLTWDEQTFIAWTKEVTIALFNLRGHAQYEATWLKAPNGTWSIDATIDHPNAFYEQFPATVMTLAESELYFNALAHYLTQWRPTKQTERRAYEERPPLFIIEWAEEGTFMKLAEDYSTAKIALSDEQLALVKEALRRGLPLPPTIPNKENAAALLSEALRLGRAEQWAHYMKTPTDVLRFAAAFVGQDYRLSSPIYWRNVSRSLRRFVLAQLNRFPEASAEMRRRKETWLRFGEALHPGDYAKAFPVAYAAFTAVRNDEVTSFSGRLEQLIAAERWDEAVQLAASRPGELARRLAHFARYVDVTEQWRAVAEQVATPVLWQVWYRFAHYEATPNKVYFPKGNVAKVFIRQGYNPPLPAGRAEQLAAVTREALRRLYGAKQALGRVYVDEQLTNYPIPFALRSASKALKTLTRGSRIPLGEGTIMRLFLWWYESETSGRVDVDLSARLYDEAWEDVTQITYYSLRDLKLGLYHSGDIVEAPHGASEYIDIDVAKAAAGGARYLTMEINSFTQQPYCDLPECFAGWMMRQQPLSGELYEPRTVAQKIDIASDAQRVMPMIVDLVKREIIWTDIALTSAMDAPNNVLNNATMTSLIAAELTHWPRPTLAQLWTLHAEARGQLVATKEEADVCFTVDDAFHHAEIMADYL